MNSSNKVSITQAAKMVGLTRATLYKHIEERGITIIKDGNSHPKIDVSELIRVYGDNLQLPQKKPTKQKIANYTNKEGGIQKIDDNIEMALLKQKIEHIEELKLSEIKRLEEHVDLLEKMLESEKEEKNKVNLLLTDQRNKSDNNGGWQQSLKSLESRIANQEKAANAKAEAEALEKTALEKQLAEQKKTMEEQEAALKDAKDADIKREEEAQAERILKEQELEASQTWVSKMFGKKKTA